MAALNAETDMTFRAFRVNQVKSKVAIAIAHSSHSVINYKHALAAMGAGKIIRRFPRVGGIDDLPGTFGDISCRRALRGAASGVICIR